MCLHLELRLLKFDPIKIILSDIYFSLTKTLIRHQKKFLDQQHKRVLFTSSFGTGKTTLLKEKAKEILEERKNFNVVRDDPKNQDEGPEDPGKVFLVLFLTKESLLNKSLKKEFEGWGEGVEIISMDDKTSIHSSKFKRRSLSYATCQERIKMSRDFKF